MKQILKIFGVVGVVLLAALMAATSCNKADGGVGGGNGGGNGGGGGGPATIPWDCSGTGYTGPIRVSRAAGADSGSVDIKSNTDNCIYVTIKGGTAGWGAFANFNEDDFNTGIRRYFYGTTEDLSRDFIDIEYTGATGGLVVVVDGTWDPTKLTIPFKGDPPGYGIKDGVHINTVKSTTGNINYINEHTASDRSVRKRGLNIFSAFIDENKYFPKIDFPAVTPTGTPNPDNKHNGITVNNIPNLQPRIFCHTVVSTIVQIPQKADLSDFAAGSILQLLNWNLTGGQKSTCRASSASKPYVKAWNRQWVRDGVFPGTDIERSYFRNVPSEMGWMQAAEQDDLNKWATAAKAQNKNEIRLRIIGVKTDGTAVKDILPGSDAAAKFTPLVGGVTPANQASIRAKILANNPALTEADISSSVGLVIRIEAP